VSARRPPLSHPLAPVFNRAIDSLSAALHPETTRHYRGTVRKFLTYLGATYPEVRSVVQLRRDPHLLPVLVVLPASLKECHGTDSLPVFWFTVCASQERHLDIAIAERRCGSAHNGIFRIVFRR